MKTIESQPEKISKNMSNKEKILIKTLKISGLMVHALIKYKCWNALKIIQPYRVNNLAKKTREVVKKNNS